MITNTPEFNASIKVAHTPGPWKVGVEYGNYQDEINAPNGKAICTVWTREGQGPRPCFKDVPEGKANARLIAAAPEMLEACKMMLEKFEHDTLPGESGWDAVTAARQAIQKASQP